MILTIILITVTLFFIIISVWNGINFRQLKKSALQVELNDAKYWELKYKHEFYIAFGSLVIGVAGLLGYNSIDSVKQSLKADFQERLKEPALKTDSLKNLIRSQDSLISG